MLNTETGVIFYHNKPQKLHR